MNGIKLVLKGMVIGVANIIPGVSGGTMAVAMGIYDGLIMAITNIFKDIKGSLKLLLPIIIGIVLGIGGLSFIINGLFATYPIQTNFFFIGLILGGLPLIFRTLKETGKRVNLFQCCFGVLFFAVVVLMATVGGIEGQSAVLTTTPMGMAQLFLVGVIASATMVIPGVSGSMVLMLLGYYYPVLEAIEVGVRSLLHFDIPLILSTTILLLPFALGILLGIGLIAKFIAWVFNSCPNYAYCSILGLILASPLAILLLSEGGIYTGFTLFTGGITFILGNIIAHNLGE